MRPNRLRDEVVDVGDEPPALALAREDRVQVIRRDVSCLAPDPDLRLRQLERGKKQFLASGCWDLYHDVAPVTGGVEESQSLLRILNSQGDFSTVETPTTYEMPESIGDRVFSIRLALGDGKRSPLSMRQFANLLAEKGEKRVDPATVSLIERGRQRPSLEDIEAIAAVDPLSRGPSWLAFGIHDENRNPLVPAWALIHGEASLLEPSVREEHFLAAQDLTLDQVKERAIEFMRDFMGQWLTSNAELNAVTVQMRAAMLERFASHLELIRNRRAVVNFQLSFAEYYRLAIPLIQATETSHEFAEQFPWPGLEGLVVVPNDEPGQPLLPINVPLAGDKFLLEIERKYTLERPTIDPMASITGIPDAYPDESLVSQRALAVEVLSAHIIAQVHLLGGARSSRLNRTMNRIAGKLRTRFDAIHSRYHLLVDSGIVAFQILLTASNVFLDRDGKLPDPNNFMVAEIPALDAPRTNPRKAKARARKTG